MAQAAAVAGLALFQAQQGQVAGSAAKEQAEFQALRLESNARFIELDAEQEIRSGQKDVENLRVQTRKKIGVQRAALAAQGIEIESGSALDIQEDTAREGEINAMTITNNARRRAFGLTVQASDVRSQARLTRISGARAQRSSIATGGLRAIRTGVGFATRSTGGR